MPAPQSRETARPAPPKAKPAARVTQPEQELTRGGFPGMLTQPLMRSAPLTKQQWDKLDQIYHTGEADSGQYVEPMQGPRRAAGSKPTAPLTPEQWKKLAEVYHLGEQHQVPAEATRGPIRAAGSKPAAPLTKEEWAALNQIYFMGECRPFCPPETEAGLRGALSIKTALDTPQEVQYGYRPALRSGMSARATEQPLPEIPDDIALGDGEIVVVARFEVAADGAAKVSLTAPPPEPKLAELLLAALRKWRFSPAYQGGRAVDSTLEVRLTISPPP
jgi:hypothetical protein